MMEEVPTSVLSAEHCHLGEGPTYDVDHRYGVVV